MEAAAAEAVVVRWWRRRRRRRLLNDELANLHRHPTLQLISPFILRLTLQLTL